MLCDKGGKYIGNKSEEKRVCMGWRDGAVRKTLVTDKELSVIL